MKTVSTPSKILQFSAKMWFITATLGQWLFGIYIILFYGKSTFTGNFQKWNEVLPKGYVPGDWKGNLLIGIHVILAIILVIGGPLQIMPFIRNRFKVFHRTLGKIYILTAVVVSLAGVLMIWTRGTVGDTFMHVANSLQAIYILFFGFMAYTSAKNRQFANHQTWALRLYLVVNGVWFFRVGLMAWLVINKAPVGFDPDTFTGPFLTFLSLFTYAIPLSLIILELYLFAQKSNTQSVIWIASLVIFLFTILTAVGIFGATMGMWLPRI
jgi:hypothetical protein